MRKFFIAAAVAVASLIGSASSADAAFTMRISDGVNPDILVTDDGTGDLATGAGKITYVGALGDWSFTVNVGQTKPFIGSAAAPELDLGYNATKTGGGAGSITIAISEEGFTTSPRSVYANIGGLLGGATTVKYETDFDNTNTLFGIGSPETSQTFNAPSYNGSAIMSITGGTPYSLTAAVTISSTSTTASASGNANITSVPAPAGLVLALAGMPMLGLGAWVRRRRTLATA